MQKNFSYYFSDVITLNLNTNSNRNMNPNLLSDT